MEKNLALTVRDKNDAMGVFRYDGEIVVPFRYSYVFISDNGFEVKRNEGDSWEHYNPK